MRSVAEVRKLCRPAPAKGTLQVYQTDHGFIRVMVGSDRPWQVTGFAVWPKTTKAEVARLYREMCLKHVRDRGVHP